MTNENKPQNSGAIDQRAANMPGRQTPSGSDANRPRQNDADGQSRDAKGIDGAAQKGYGTNDAQSGRPETDVNKGALKGGAINAGDQDYRGNQGSQADQSHQTDHGDRRRDPNFPQGKAQDSRRSAPDIDGVDDESPLANVNEDRSGGKPMKNDRMATPVVPPTGVDTKSKNM